MALGIGTDRFITLGRQATGDGIITTDIGTTVTTGFITDGGNVKNVSQFWRTAVCIARRMSLHAWLFKWHLLPFSRLVACRAVIAAHEHTGDFKEP